MTAAAAVVQNMLQGNNPGIKRFKRSNAASVHSEHNPCASPMRTNVSAPEKINDKICLFFSCWIFPELLIPECLRGSAANFLFPAIRLIRKMSFHTNLPPCDEQCDGRRALDGVDGWSADDKYPSEALGLSAAQT